jgi:hypothetical protein
MESVVDELSMRRGDAQSDDLMWAGELIVPFFWRDPGRAAGH